MRTLPELLNSWLPASDRASLLVVGSDTAPFVPHLEALQKGDGAYEVVRVQAPADGQRLVRRGAIAALIVEAGNPLPGNLELLLEAVSKDKPPQILVASPQSKAQTASKAVEAVNAYLDGNGWRSLIGECVKRFQSGKVAALRAGDLLEALAAMPDEGWLRVCSGDEFGDICVSKGRAIYCEVGRLSGEEAAAKIAGWTNCLFEYRMLPEFLRENMDRPLNALSGGAPAAQPAPAMEVELEEPDQFPVFEGMSGTTASQSTAADPPADLDLEEPEDLPTFDLKSGEAEIVVEEPEELLIEEPGTMDFEIVSRPARIFESVAVFCMNRMVSCEPPIDARYYDPETLSVFYEKSKAYVMRHQLGETPILQIGGGDCTILVVAAVGGDCLVAARTTVGQVTPEQRQELERLIHVHGTASPAFAR